MALCKVRDRGKSSVVVSVIVLCLGGAIIFGSGCGTPTTGSTPLASTISNAKQVALATIMYAADWNDRYPLGMSSGRKFQRAVNPYVKNSSVFRSLNPAGGMIGPNPNLVAVPTAGIIDPAATPLVFETYDWPDGKRVVAYTDGHAKFIEGFDVATDLEVELDDEARSIVDELALELEAAVSVPPAAGPLGMPRG